VNPKLFISYSWSSPEHEKWVIEVATQLREAGVDVILDKWDLKEGHDAYAYMEKMVNDSDIQKVALICDKVYATKANSRSGGVGTETQIITPEIYAQNNQSKFVAIITERDEFGKAYVPSYYASKIYIDFTDPSSYAQNFEQLVRWIYDKPRYVKPVLGKMPAFLSEDSSTIRLSTSASFNRVIDAVKNRRDYYLPAIKEYFELFVSELEKFRIDSSATPKDDAVVNSIDEFIPYRNEVITLLTTICIYSDNAETRNAVHRFFEKLIKYTYPPQDSTLWNEYDFDNFKFIVRELFLYAIACYLKYECFESVIYLMETEYYIGDIRFANHGQMVPYIQFDWHPESINSRNSRLKLNKLSLIADMLKERSMWSPIDFNQVMAADFILFFRSKVKQDGYYPWLPDTLVYFGRFGQAFEIFARAKSAKYFSRAVNNKAELEAATRAMEEDRQSMPRWQHLSINPSHILGLEGIATTP